jgi:hypothetical protein
MNDGNAVGKDIMTNFTIIDFEPRTLALANDRDEAAAVRKLDAFLLQKGIVPEHRYQNEIVVKKNGLRLVAYIKLATVPKGTAKSGDVSVTDLGAGLALSFFVSAAEYERFSDGDLKPELDAFMEANGLGLDLSKVLVLAEKTDEGFACTLPVRRK